MAYKFPWTNYHELNLDWILDTVKKLFAQTEQNNEIVEQYDGRLTEVELTADNAQTAAEQAQSNSATALDLAQNAAQTATQAQQAAATAQQAAGQAQTAAGQALEAAATAQQTAAQAQQTAQNFDGRIRQAEDNAASALQAAQAFDEQVQGAITAANNANEAATAALTSATETARELAAQRDTLEDIIENAAQSLEVDLSTKADVIINTAEGEIASFNDGVDDMPIKKLVVNIEPVQSGSGDPSPDNVRPISGRTGAEVTQTGVNVWDEEYVTNGYFDASGNWVADNYLSSKNPIPVKPNTTYYCHQGAGALYVTFWTEEVQSGVSAPDKFISRLNRVENNTFTTPANAQWMHFNTTSYGTTYNNDISINYPATDTTYHPYTGNQISVNWEDEAGTVYGGMLDVTQGKMVVDRAIVDMGTLSWQFREALGGFSATVTPLPKYYFVAISSCYPYKGIYSSVTDKTFGYIYYNQVFIRDSAYLDAALLKTSLNGQTLVYELATPIEYQLTSHEVKTLFQYNNIWSDVGSVDVEYPADTKTYIDNKFAELQALILDH